MMPKVKSEDLGDMGSGQPDTQPSTSDRMEGLYVTLERLVPSHIPLLFTGLGFPQNNHILDWINGFPYIYTEEELSNHLLGYLRNNPDLNIFVIKACQSHLGPPSPPGIEPHTSVLGIIGYRLHEPSRTIKWDDIIYSPVLHHTYAGTEAHSLLIRYLFEGQTIPYYRIWATSNALNTKSRQHQERLGFTYEGTFRKDSITRWGTRRDTDCTSMLVDEWPLAKRVLQKYLSLSNFDSDGKQIKSIREVRSQMERCSL